MLTVYLPSIPFLCRLVQDVEAADVSSLCPKEPGGLSGLGKCGCNGCKGAKKLSNFGPTLKLGSWNI